MSFRNLFRAKPLTNWHKRLLFFVVGASAALLGAWYYQITTQLSYATQVFNQVTAATVSPVPTPSNPGGTNCAVGTACPIQDSGSGAHWFKVCIVGGNVTNSVFEGEGSDDQVNWMQITNQATLIGSTGCAILEGAGYFRWLRLNLITFTGSGTPKVSAWYSGIGTAISGGGIIAGNKPSVPVTFVPDLSFFNGALKSTFANIASGGMSIDFIECGNPNASIVYCQLTGLSGASLTVAYMVPANQSTIVPVGRGIQAGVVSAANIACSTSPTLSTDPGTGCVVTVHYKPFITVNTNVNSGGSSVASGSQPGN